MSSIINKVKDAMSSDNKTTTTTSQNDSTTLNTRNDTVNDPRNDSSRAAQTAHGTSGRTHDGSYSDNTNSALGQEANRGVDGPAKKTDGPHKSDLLNKLDPRIDSDRDHSKNLGANSRGDATTGKASSGESNTTTGRAPVTSSFDPAGSTVASGSDPRIDPEMNYSQQSHGTTGLSGGANTHPSSGRFDNSNNIPEGTFGQHNSRLANAADPRVDSDLDSRQHHQTTRTNATSGTSGVTGSTRQNDNIPEGTFGHHNSRLANAADPRVDSDLDSGRTHQQSTTTGGTFGSSNTGSRHEGVSTGSHGSQPGYSRNTADTNFTSGTQPGPASNTAGPHKSDALNKADPRVDSNLDGSKTYGGNKTYDQGTATSTTRRDPTDASQVPPSVLQQNVGKPTGQYDEGTQGRF